MKTVPPPSSNNTPLFEFLFPLLASTSTFISLSSLFLSFVVLYVRASVGGALCCCCCGDPLASMIGTSTRCCCGWQPRGTRRRTSRSMTPSARWRRSGDTSTATSSSIGTLATVLPHPLSLSHAPPHTHAQAVPGARAVGVREGGGL